MVIRSFAAPVGIALAGGVAGLLAAQAGWQYVFPYALMQSGMNSNTLVELNAATSAQIVVASLAWTAAAVAACVLWLRARDVRAG